LSSPWSDNSQHAIYCRLDDTVNNSVERNVTLLADNTVPNITLVGVDGDTSSPYWGHVKQLTNDNLGCN